jgi:iron complex transport system substrate-binding protein
MSKRSFIFILILMLVFSFSACSAKTEVDENVEVISGVITEEIPYLVFTDGIDREVTIDLEPMTIISVAPSVTETIFALGAGDKLVGRTDYCDYPLEVSEVESIGSLMDVNIEKIVEINPDIVLASTHFKEETLEKLENLNIKVAVIISEETFEGVYSNIETIGKIVNKNNEANEIVNTMKEKVNYVKETVKDLDKKSIYYVVGYGEYGDFTATGDTFISEMLETAGGENAAKDAVGWKYSLEKLVEKNPNILLCKNDENTINEIKKANGYKDLTAVKEGFLIGVDKNSVERMGPRLADGLIEIAKAIYPEIFK